jgi:hypothetical protein
LITGSITLFFGKPIKLLHRPFYTTNKATQVSCPAIILVEHKPLKKYELQATNMANMAIVF